MSVGGTVTWDLSHLGRERQRLVELGVENFVREVHRASGRTTRILRHAAVLAEAGHSVTVVLNDAASAKLVEKLLAPFGEVKAIPRKEKPAEGSIVFEDHAWPTETPLKLEFDVSEGCSGCYFHEMTDWRGQWCKLTNTNTAEYYFKDQTPDDCPLKKHGLVQVGRKSV